MVENITDEDFGAMLGGEQFKRKLDNKLFRQIQNNTRNAQAIKTELLLHPETLADKIELKRIQAFNERVAKKLNKESSSISDSEYLSNLFESIESGPRDNTNEYYNHLPYFRSVIKHLIAMKRIDLSEELNRFESKYDLTKRRYGCLSCPYKGTKVCPYGIGILKAEEDILNKQGFLVTKKGEIMEMHPNKICDERLVEYQNKFKAFNQLTGLKDARTESLMRMDETVNAVRAKLQELLAEQEVQEKFSSNEKGTGGKGLFFVKDDGDTSIKTALTQLDIMQQRYHEQLNKAIQQEEGVKSVVEKRISADDLNNMMKKARAIDVTSKREELESKKDE